MISQSVLVRHPPRTSVLRRALLAIVLVLPTAVIAPTSITAQTVQELEVGKGGYGFHGTLKGKIRSFNSDREARKVVRTLMESIGLPLRFEIRAADVPNAHAIVTNDGRRLILYSNLFMQEVQQKTHRYWSLISIMAHEIGHHLSFHMTGHVENHTAELEADYFSGYILAKNGAQIEDALAAMRAIASVEGSKSHPPRRSRLEAIYAGWKNANMGLRPDPKRTQTPALSSNIPNSRSERPHPRIAGSNPAQTTTLSFNPNAHPSFNCDEYGKKPIGHVDRNPQTDALCLDAEAAAIDAQLGKVFRAFLKRHPKSAKKRIIRDQKRWILARNAQCPATWQGLADVAARQRLAQCLIQHTRERIFELRQ